MSTYIELNCLRKIKKYELVNVIVNITAEKQKIFPNTISNKTKCGSLKNFNVNKSLKKMLELPWKKIICLGCYFFIAYDFTKLENLCIPWDHKDNQSNWLTSSNLFSFIRGWRLSEPVSHFGIIYQEKSWIKILISKDWTEYLTFTENKSEKFSFLFGTSLLILLFWNIFFNYYRNLNCFHDENIFKISRSLS